jgi:hypothetical protein
MKKIITTIIIVLTALIIFTPKTASNTAGPDDGEPSIRKPAIEQATTTKKIYYDTAPEGLADEKRYKDDLRAIATAKGLSETKIREIETVINCESTWNSKAVGDDGNSMGLVQISLIHWPEITQEQAFDSEFALNFIVDRFLEGREHLWTCWRIHYTINA